MHRKINISAIYAIENKEAMLHLLRHLKPLETEFNLAIWHDDPINTGQLWQPQNDALIDQTDIFLLVVSDQFMHSEFIKQLEFKLIIDRYKDDKAEVLPIILDNCQWDIEFQSDDYNFKLSELAVLPNQGKPIVAWDSPSMAYKGVSEHVKRVISSYIENHNQKTSDTVPEVQDTITTSEEQLAIRFSEEAESKKNAKEEHSIRDEAEPKIKVDEKNFIRGSDEAKNREKEERKIRPTGETKIRAKEKIRKKEAVEAKRNTTAENSISEEAEVNRTVGEKNRLGESAEAKTRPNEETKVREMAEAKSRAVDKIRIEAAAEAKRRVEEEIRIREAAEAKRRDEEEIRIRETAENKRKVEEMNSLGELAEAKRRAVEEESFGKELGISNIAVEDDGPPPVAETNVSDEETEVQKKPDKKKGVLVLSIVILAGVLIWAFSLFNSEAEIQPQPLPKGEANTAKDSVVSATTNNDAQNTEKTLSKLQIGDTYEGGIIFTINQAGTTGKIAHIDDAGPMTWINAMKIDELLGEGWRLPSFEELAIMYRNIGQGNNNKGEFADGLYWSATAYDDYQARLLRFRDGNTSYHYNKELEHRKYLVRAIRDFSR